MRPPPIYPQLHHIHNHGLAMLACITPFRNLRLSQYIEAIWKEVSEEVIFSSNIFKTPESSRDGAWKKDKEKEKLPSSNKKGSQYFERRKTLQLQKSFLMWFHFLPLHHTISKTISKIIEKVFLTLFGPSFSLAIYMTWVVPFLFTHELHIFSL
jgi:hypothetical protein